MTEEIRKFRQQLDSLTREWRAARDEGTFEHVLDFLDSKFSRSDYQQMKPEPILHELLEYAMHCSEEDDERSSILLALAECFDWCDQTGGLTPEEMKSFQQFS